MNNEILSKMTSLINEHTTYNTKLGLAISTSNFACRKLENKKKKERNETTLDLNFTDVFSFTLLNNTSLFIKHKCFHVYRCELCLSVCLSVCLFVCMSVCLSVCLSLPSLSKSNSYCTFLFA